MKSGIIIQVLEVPYDVWEKLESCENLDQAYKRLDELEEEAIKKKYPSDVMNYRVWHEQAYYLQRNRYKSSTNMETKVSKTGEGELLIHKEDGKGGYINLIIDSDGDIEIMHITSDRKGTWNKVNVSVDEAIKFWNEN